MFRFLIVDDNDNDALLLSHLVESEFSVHAKCEHATTRKQALSWLDTNRHAPFDAILLDLNLPDSNGVETFRAVKMAAAGIPIVIHSGREDERGTRDLLIEEGADGYIEKSAEKRHHVAVFNALYDAAKRSATTVHMGLDERQVLLESERRGRELVHQSRASDPPMSHDHLQSEAIAASIRMQGQFMKRQVATAEDIGSIKATLAALQDQLGNVEVELDEVEETGRFTAIEIDKTKEEVKANRKKIAAISGSIGLVMYGLGESPLLEWLMKFFGGE